MLGMALVATVFACLGTSTPAFATTTYYVDTQNPLASNSNPGTEELPYLTISGAANVRKGPGIIIVVKPGTYRETVTVPASGTANDPYVFRASGPGVILDGSDDLSDVSNWAPYTGTVYVAAGVTWSPKQVFVDGVRLTPTTGSPDTLPVNKFVFVGGGQGGLYVNLGGDSPGLHTTLVGRRLHGFRTSNKQYVTIEGFTVARTEDRGIYALNGAHSTVIASNTVTHAYRFGIAVEACQGVLVAQNDVGHGQDHGIALTANSSGCTLRNNESYHNVHPTIRQANGIYCNGATNNVFEGNRVHHNQDSGLQQSTSSSGNLAIQNISWSNGDHGFDVLNSSNATLLGCVAYGNYKDGFSIEGSSTGAKVYNCIGVDNGLHVLPADGTLEPDLWVDAQASPGFQSDYNIWWNSTTLAPVKYIHTWYSDLATFSAATGLDWNSKQMNPQFVDPANGNFELLPTSPAIDAGHSGIAAWPPLDALGRSRKDAPLVANTGIGAIAYADRGALEYQVDQRPIVAAPTAVAAIEGVFFAFAVHALDPDGEGLSSLIATNLPAGAMFTTVPGDSVGLFSWTPGFGHSGPHSLTFTASNSLSGSTVTTITVANVDRAPVVAAPATVPASEGQPVSFIVHAADPDGEALSSLVASDLPEGATFTTVPGDTAGTFSWTPAFGQSASFNVTFTASNALSSSAVTIVAVSNVDRAPVVAAPTSVHAIEGQPVTFDVHAADPDGHGIHSLTATDLPEGATFTPAAGDSVGTFSWTPAFGQSGSFPVTFTAANSLTGTAVTTVTVGNVDRPPVVAVQTSLTTNDGQLLSLQVIASDADGDSILSLTATDLPDGATFTSNAAHTQGTFLWTPSAAQASQFTVTFTATNALTGSASIEITVLAVTAVDPAAAIPARPILSPSPIRSRSTLSFYLPAPGPLDVGIHDAAGRRVRHVASEREAAAGVHHLEIDGRSDSGERLASGVYFYSIRTAQGTKTGRVVIAR